MIFCNIKIAHDAGPSESANMRTVIYFDVLALGLEHKSDGQIFIFGSASLLEIIANSDRRHDLEFDWTEETTLVREVEHLVDFN